jgi:hypothetical protein
MRVHFISYLKGEIKMTITREIRLADPHRTRHRDCSLCCAIFLSERESFL